MRLFTGQSVFDQIILRASGGITVAGTSYKTTGGVLPMAMVGLTKTTAPTQTAGATYGANEQTLLNGIVTALKASGLMT